VSTTPENLEFEIAPGNWNFIDAPGKFNCQLNYDYVSHVFVSRVVILRRRDQCKNSATLLNVAWKSGNLFGCFCTHL